MATSRKRASSSFGFSSESIEEVSNLPEKEEIMEVVYTDLPEPIEEPKVFVEELIIPTEDPGPRFVEVQEEPAEPVKISVEATAPRRHPRNTPKFSRTA